jgi:hypothetical protein
MCGRRDESLQIFSQACLFGAKLAGAGKETLPRVILSAVLTGENTTEKHSNYFCNCFQYLKTRTLDTSFSSAFFLLQCARRLTACISLELGLE